MAIKKVQEVTINGSKRAFGGTIYNVRYSPNFSDAPARVEASVVNEEGEYREPNLSTKIPYRIKIANILDGDFYAVSYKEDDSGQGKFLNVSFLDGSFILDKIVIGLHKRYGIIPSKIQDRRKPVSKTQEGNRDRLEWFNSSPSNPKFEENNKYQHYYIQRDGNNKPTNLVIIGQEFHPCDRDLDGVIDFEKDGEFDKDACDPCPNCPEEKYDEATNRSRCEEIACTQIFEVKYNFRTLLAAIREVFSQSNIKISINEDSLPDTNDDYYASYEGSLRDVLREWCADYGYNFYCELNNDTRELELHFIDVKHPIDIILPEDIQNQAVIEKTNEKSIEETIHRASISLFQKEGEIKEYTCEKEDILTLRPLTLKDMYSRLSGITTADPEILKAALLTDVETSCSLMRINSNLRDLFWFLNFYKIEGPEAAIKCIYKTHDPKVEEEYVPIPLGTNNRIPWGGQGKLSFFGTVDTEEESNKGKVWDDMARFGARELGDFKIYAVVHTDGYSYSKAPATEDKGKREREIISKKDGGLVYKRLLAQMNEQDLDFFNSVTIKEKHNEFDIEGKPISNSKQENYPGYFIIAHQDESILENIHDIENRLANEFMGRFFFRKLDLNDKYRSCSGNFGTVKDKKSFSIDCRSPDGSGRVVFFGEDESFKELPIFNFGHSNSSFVGKLMKDMETSLRKKEFDRKDVNYLEEDTEYEEALVLVERDAKWYPSKENTPKYEKIVEYYNRRMFKHIGGSGKGDELAGLINTWMPDLAEDPNLKVFACYPSKMGVKLKSNSSNPLDTKSRTSVIAEVERDGCNNNCEDDNECFKGEQNPVRRNRLINELNKLVQQGKKGTHKWSKLHREIYGDKCVSGDCRHQECGGFGDCANVIAVIGGKPFYDKTCYKGKCVDMFGLRSNICMEIDVEGLKILCPSQSCDFHGQGVIAWSDSGELQSMNSARGYDCMLVQSYTQKVVIPKIQNIVQEDISEQGDVLQYDINFLDIPYEDIMLMSGNICRPDQSLIENAHQKYNKDLTFNIEQPFETHTFTISDIDLVSSKDVSIRNGLTGLDVTIGSSGVTTSYTFSNKAAQPIRINLLKRLIELNRRRNTNVNTRA